MSWLDINTVIPVSYSALAESTPCYLRASFLLHPTTCFCFIKFITLLSAYFLRLILISTSVTVIIVILVLIAISIKAKANFKQHAPDHGILVAPFCPIKSQPEIFESEIKSCAALFRLEQDGPQKSTKLFFP